MKPLLFRVPKTEIESFRVQEDCLQHFYDSLHFHPEYQVTLIIEGTGTLFVGDRIDRFQPFDLFFLGSNIPHVFRSDAEYYDTTTQLNVHSISIYFRKEVFGESLFELPEMGAIKDLLIESSRGIRIGTKSDILPLMQQIIATEGFERMLSFWKILYEVVKSNNREALSSITYHQPQKENDNKRINAVFDFLMQHYAQEISLEQVAEIANMTTNAFCRFFKLHTRKTFSDFLNDIRIGHACKMLTTDKFSVSEICFACGFNNLSNFNRQFRRRMAITPTDYAKKYLMKK
ncbi:MAG: AraC family transcriptional regulator [Spirosomaceae bacterium]|jgi:AraC-like DNA-binding protein|nr:AraC family transcriptional regulator [Spirosomataceae bacterium]